MRASSIPCSAAAPPLSIASLSRTVTPPQGSTSLLGSASNRNWWTTTRRPSGSEDTHMRNCLKCHQITGSLHTLCMTKIRTPSP
uniref:Uncharacterized protein n=1 Tax=Arundo donax TaxID=35708 RepID=A0A0A8XX26_ARUDO